MFNCSETQLSAAVKSMEALKLHGLKHEQWLNLCLDPAVFSVMDRLLTPFIKGSVSIV